MSFTQFQKLTAPTFVVGEIRYTADSVTYQRNGVCGEGFYQVHFHNSKHKFVAVVFASSDEEGYESRRPNGYCAVTTPDEPQECWRGDMFEQALRRLIVRHIAL